MEITGPVPPIIITKFNRFADNIIERMNGVLRKNYDPVNVKLHSNNGNNTVNNNNKNKTAGKKKPGPRRNHNGRQRKFHITFRNM